MDQIVRLEKVTKKFQLFWEELIIFEQIDFEVERDELVLIYGPSGSGKTTLLNLITGLLHQDEGEIQVAGLYIDLIADREKSDFRSSYLGIVFQENNLISTLTVEENIILFRELCDGKDIENKEEISELLKKLGIYQRRDSFPVQLSGGEKKRVAIARALSNNPNILILDEPTGNLDRESADKICELIHEIFQTTDITIIVCSHDPKMKDIASSIYKVENKKILLEENHPEKRKHKKTKYRPILAMDRAVEDIESLDEEIDVSEEWDYLTDEEMMNEEE